MKHKRMLSLIMALALVLAMFPAAPQVQAEEVPTMSTEVCPCCGKAWKDIKWTEYDKLSNSLGALWGGGVDFSKAGHYRITGSFTMKKEFTVAAKVTIDFNGLLLQAASGKRGFTVKSGGNLTLINTGGNNGRLGGKNTSSEGGAVKVEAGGTLNVLSGRVVGTSMSNHGGTIYNEGTVNIAGGEIEGGKANGKNGGNIYNAGTVNLYGGLVESGSAKIGGNIYNSGSLNLYGGSVEGGTTSASGDGGNVYNTGALMMEGGAITAGTVTGDDGYGGNIYSSADSTITLKNGIISDGTSEDHGGNIFCTKGTITLYGGAISGGTVTGGTKDDGTGFAGGGGNIYITGTTGTIYLYDGTISGGRNTYEASPGAANIMLNTGAQLYMYGGTLATDSPNKGGNLNITSSATLEDETKQYSAAYILGGTLTNSTDSGLDFFTGTSNVLAIYSCRYSGGADISAYVADCCCSVTDDTGITVWNAGYRDGTCTDCLYAQAAAQNLVTPVAGGHNYAPVGENTYSCTGCGKVSVFEFVGATLNGELFESPEAAFAAAAPGDKLILMTDATLEEAVVGYTLDLNGHRLITPVFTSAVGGDVIDSSSDCSGVLISESVTLAENNSYLPVTYQDGIRFCQVGFDQWVEPIDTNTTKIKFRFTQNSRQTILDDAINAGNTELDVLIRLTWTDGQGQKQDKTFLFGSQLLQKYAQKWDGRVFVTTITGTAKITNLTFAYQVSSTAATGALKSAKTVKATGYINNVLSWEKINSYPIKTSDMTVEEMRQLCVDFMEFNKTYLWTPSEDVAYIRNSAGTADSMAQGTVYGGLPYVGVASGNPYRMMDYINENGIVDMQKALPALGTKDRLEMSDLKYFGSQCSICVYWAWGRVINSVNYAWTQNATPYNNFIILGDVQIPDTVKSWNTTYGTDECVAENGEQVMFGGYAQLQKADGMVYYTTAGHLIMAYSDPVVVYNDDGTINGDASYIYIIDQGQGWETVTNAEGDTYRRKGSVASKKTFTKLFESNYIPFTFEEFLGEDPIEQTQVSLINGKTTLITGTISEEDRAFQATTSANKLTWSQFMSSKVDTNYGVVDVYLIAYDNLGNEIYRHAVRTPMAGDVSLNMAETGAMVTVWQTKALQSGKTYNAKIEVQLSTGERPVIWSGQLTID